jgi:hypothetical protein
MSDNEKRWRQSLRELLEARFGPQPSEILARLEELSLDRMQSLLRAALKAQSLAELGLID